MGEQVRGTVDITIKAQESGNTTNIFIVISGSTDTQGRQAMIQGIKDLAQQCGLSVVEVSS